MSPGELAWRVQGLVRDVLDRPRVQLRLVPHAVHSAAALAQIRATAVPLCDQPVGCWTTASDDTHRIWRDRLTARADALLDHRFTFFSLENHPLGNPIDWNRDHETGDAAPLQFSSGIDYRDTRVTGDAKVVWEPGRHHQLVVLGRAYRATGDERYARDVIAQIDSWLAQCPFGTGMHWRSPLELAIRAINWVWAIDLIRGSAALADPAFHRLLNALYLHVWDVRRKYSRGSSANNHRIGEAAAVFVVTSCLPGIEHAAAWAAESRAILEGEILAQTFDDGGSQEQAFGYHLFVLQFLVAAGFVARKCGKPFSKAFEERLARMTGFGAVMLEGGPPPMFGDADDGYLLDLGAARQPEEWIGAAAALLDRPDLDAGRTETAFWLLGVTPDARAALPSGVLGSHALAESGYYLLQSGSRGGDDAISVLFDCGALGFGSIAAHGHADALSFMLRVCGEDVLVDPGTYDYFRFPEWRDYFRSTRAHNTVGVDGLDQSTMLGPFMWAQRAAAHREEWQPRANGGIVSGRHDGYARLTDPVRHRRRLDLDGERGILTVEDALQMNAAHAIAIYFHFADHCRVSVEGGSIHATSERSSLRIEPDPRLSVSLQHGSENPIAGWTSRTYHRKSAAATLVLSGQFDRDVTLLTSLTIGRPSRRGPSEQSLAVVV